MAANRNGLELAFRRPEVLPADNTVLTGWRKRRSIALFPPTLTSLARRMRLALAPDEFARRRATEDRVAQARGITRRAAWGAQVPVHPLEPDWNYDSIVVHYTGHGSYPDMKSVQAFDIEHRAWDDVAYHYAVSPAGQLFEGRELVYKGSHVKLQNTGKIGIVCMGDFDSGVLNLLEGRSYGGDTVQPPMLAALKRLSQVLVATFPIKVFGGHKEFGESETCPGTNLLPAVQKMREELRLTAPTYRNL